MVSLLHYFYLRQKYNLAVQQLPLVISASLFHPEMFLNEVLFTSQAYHLHNNCVKCSFPMLYTVVAAGTNERGLLYACTLLLARLLTQVLLRCHIFIPACTLLQSIADFKSILVLHYVVCLILSKADQQTLHPLIMSC